MEPQGGTYPVRLRLPVSYSTEIGRIITRWAILEWRLRETAYLLLDLDPKLGRLAVREPRVTDYVTMIEDICRVTDIPVTTNFKDTRKLLTEYKGYRDAIAHGIWLKHSETKAPTLQVIAGSYPVETGGGKVKARIHPQAVAMDLPTLKQIRKAIEIMVVRIERLRGQVQVTLDARRQKESATQ